MVDNKNSCIVLGEASESDEEDLPQENSSTKNVLSTAIVSGEASESETEYDGDYNITAEAFKTKAEEIRYNSLLHKKLRESNAKLKEDMKELAFNSLRFATDSVNEINQRLLTNQIEIQETIKHLRRSTVSSEKLDNIMSCIVKQSYLPSINIK